MNQRKRILTGDRPTSRLHIGHYAGSLENRVKLQDEYEQFIIISDVQALTTHFENPHVLKQNVLDLCIDYLSVGIDPMKSSIFIQSEIPQIAELTVFYSMFVMVNLLRHNPTIKTEAKQYGYKDLTYGFLGYPVSQAADITFCMADLVPVGEDQLPVIEVTRKIVRKFNSLYGSVLKEPETLLGSCPRLIGLDGNSKMSKSLNNAIFLSDDRSVIIDKVKKAVTDPNRTTLHIKGNPSVCTVYKYHQVFNQKECDNLCEMCKNASLGCTSCKNLLSVELDNLLFPFREKRKYYEGKIPYIRELLEEGAVKARDEGTKTLNSVKEAMKIDY